MATTTNLNTLKINYLTQAQYETALGNNQIDANELYFTPNSEEAETDPVFKASPAYGITDTNISNWNSKTSNTGTVTSVAASGSGGITISGSPITTDGTIAIGLNLSTAINGLSEGTSPATINDYIVAQYAGGGTITTTYYRRKLSNIIVGKAIADQNGLTIDTGYLKLTGGTMTGALTLPQLNIPGASDRVFSFKLSNNDTNVDIGWDWTNADGAGAALRSADPSRTDCGQFVFFARAKNTNDEPVYTQLVGTPGETNNAGILTWGGRRVVTSTNSSAVGSVNQPVYVDANGHLQVSKSFAEYLPLTGGNVTGPTTFGDTVSIDDLSAGQLVVSGSASVTNELRVNKITITGAIAYQGSQATYDMIKWKDNTGDVYGNGIVIGGGGLVVIGGGESADAVAATYASGGSEELSLTSDGIIKIWTNVQNGAASAHTETINANGVYSGTAVTATKLTDYTNGNDTWLDYGAPGLSSCTYLGAWNGYRMGAIKPENISAGSIQVPRVGNANTIDVKSAPTRYRAKVQEYGPSCLNLPTTHWYFVETWRGQDNNYCAQLALGETTDDAYFRILQNTVWGSWRRITTGARNITMSTSGPSGGSNGDIWFVYV